MEKRERSVWCSCSARLAARSWASARSTAASMKPEALALYPHVEERCRVGLSMTNSWG